MDAPFENGEAPIEPEAQPQAPKALDDRPSRACAPSSAAPGARSVSIHAITWIGEKALDARRKKRFAASLRPRDVATPEHATEACKVCGLAHSDEQDALLYCDCCDRCFHQKCYHVPEIPEGDWFCRPCLKKKAKGVPPAMVPDPPGVDDDGERVAGDPDAAKAVIADLLYLDALEDGTTDPGGPKPIQLVINSSGGVVTSGLAIYDVMQYVRSPVHTPCIGHAASMAAILLAAGEPRQRRALPHARIMVHSASGGYGRNKVEDVLVHAEELKAKNDLLAAILADHLGLSVEQVMEMWSVDNYMRCDAPRPFGGGCPACCYVPPLPARC